jgi:SAM-dependent methyltransferase
MRDYWDARAHENSLWYVDTSLDYDTPDFERFMAGGEQVVRQALLEAPVQPSRRGLAVEIGCGVGRICRALAEHFEAVIGVDVSEEMVNQARALVTLPSVRFETVSGADLAPVKDASADLVTTFTVFQHMPTATLIEAYVREAARVLRPGGVLAAQWNNLPHPRRWQAQAKWWRLRQRIGRPALDQRVAPEFIGIRLPASEMITLIERAGLRVNATAQLGTLFAWVWATKD